MWEGEIRYGFAWLGRLEEPERSWGWWGSNNQIILSEENLLSFTEREREKTKSEENDL